MSADPLASRSPGVDQPGPDLDTFLESLRPFLLKIATRLRWAAGMFAEGRDGHDLVQEVLIEVWQHMDEFRDLPGDQRGRMLTGYLGMRARNLFRRHARAKARERLSFTAPAPAPPLELLLGAEWEGSLREAMEMLSGPWRTAVIGHYLEGQTWSEVGDRLGCSERAARKAAARAIHRLRLALG